MRDGHSWESMVILPSLDPDADLKSQHQRELPRIHGIPDKKVFKDIDAEIAEVQDWIRIDRYLELPLF